MAGIIDEWWLRLIAGLIGSGIIAAGAYRLRALSASGAWSAVAMGTFFVTLGEPVWFGLLLFFFGSSTIWSIWKKRSRVKQSAEANYEKTGRRDAGQVWANGGAGLLLCALHAVWPSDGWLFAYIGVMAAVTADTWATEIGVLSRAMPRSVINGKRVSPGTSGGVTLLGSVAALGGAALTGVAAGLLAETQLLDESRGLTVVMTLTVAVLSGLFGAFADSWLGATGQAMYRCRVCGSVIERADHCGEDARHERGFVALTNDRVNMLSSLLAGLLAWGMSVLLL